MNAFRRSFHHRGTQRPFFRARPRSHLASELTAELVRSFPSGKFGKECRVDPECHPVSSTTGIVDVTTFDNYGLVPCHEPLASLCCGSIDEALRTRVRSNCCADKVFLQLMVRLVTLFVASPGDVATERQDVAEVANSLNRNMAHEARRTVPRCSAGRTTPVAAYTIKAPRVQSTTTCPLLNAILQ